MAGPIVVRHVTEALLGILRNDLVGVLPAANIKALPPEDIEGVSDQTLLLYLYQVVESPTLRNVGPRQEIMSAPPSPNVVTVRRDPLALDLYYLLIPGANNTDPAYLDTYDILGSAMKSFHDHGSFTLGDWVTTTLPADEVNLKFRVQFNRLDTSDLIRIWEAVQRPYRLSVSYVVRTIQIESDLISDTKLVSERRLVGQVK